MDINAIAMSLIIPLGAIFLAVLIWCELGRGRWKCPECDFWCWSREEALGHQAMHALHKPVQEL